MKAWLKLQLLCHAGDTEIGAFAITANEDPLYVIDLVTIKQSCTCISVEFDDDAVADFFDEQVDAGRSPEQFFRIWAHTHPGDSPQPSCTDEETFQRVFGTCDWAVMFILARGGDTYCRLCVNSGGNCSGHDKAKGRSISLATTIPCEVDHASIVSDDFALPLDQWIEEYQRNVSVEAPLRGRWWQDEQLPLGEAMDLSQIDDDLVDELMGLDDEALQSLMEALDEQSALRNQMQEVADAK